MWSKGFRGRINLPGKEIKSVNSSLAIVGANNQNNIPRINH
jgi:hypothetical protein